MRIITIHVSEEVYASYQDRAKEQGASASELIRNAMAEYAERHFPAGESVFNHEPADVGRVIQPLEAGDDLLEEMLG